jgi:hypothetical protein
MRLATDLKGKLKALAGTCRRQPRIDAKTRENFLDHKSVPYGAAYALHAGQPRFEVAWWPAPKRDHPRLWSFVAHAQFCARRKFPEISKFCNHAPIYILNAGHPSWPVIRSYEGTTAFPAFAQRSGCVPATKTVCIIDHL